jgi:hypothetical protein
VEEKKPDVAEPVRCNAKTATTTRPPSMAAPTQHRRRLLDHLPPLSNDMLAKFVRLLIPLTVACAAYLKPETSSRKTYDVLAHNLEEQSKAAMQNHEDIVALRNYLEGYTRHEAENGVAYQVASAQPPPAMPTAAVPPPKTVVKIKRVEPAPAPPPASPAPATYVAKNYKSVTGTDDIK